VLSTRPTVQPPTSARCRCARAGLPAGAAVCVMCELDEINGLPPSVPTVPAPPPTDAELCAIYLRAFDALTGARATERRALEQLTEGAQQMVARAMLGREGA
jgi:hypothetical protein